MSQEISLKLCLLNCLEKSGKEVENEGSTSASAPPSSDGKESG